MKGVRHAGDNLTIAFMDVTYLDVALSNCRLAVTKMARRAGGGRSDHDFAAACLLTRLMTSRGDALAFAVLFRVKVIADDFGCMRSS